MKELLGKRIRELRGLRGMSLDDLAKKAGASKSYIWELENKQPPRPSAEKLSGIAAALDTTLEGLLGITPSDDEVLPEDRAFFRKYRGLAPKDRRVIRRLIDSFGDDTTETWANRLLEVEAESSGNPFPVDVERIALSYSYDQYPDDPIVQIETRQLTNYEGVLKRSSADDGWTIQVAESIRTSGRRRFTIAHELGHYLIHRREYPDGFQCTERDLRQWDSEYHQVEREANNFAADLLMPLSDFQQQIGRSVVPDMEDLRDCASRYNVSFTAAILRWLSYTVKRALLVVSQDGFVKWSRSSEPAFRSGAFVKAGGRRARPVPERSLAAVNSEVSESAMDHPKGVWLDEPAREQRMVSSQYGQTLSLLVLLDSAPSSEIVQLDMQGDEDVGEDVPVTLYSKTMYQEQSGG